MRNENEGSILRSNYTTPLNGGQDAELEGDMIALILASLGAVVDRQKLDYPFIDTKFDLATGKDFPVEDKLRGPDTIYTWIQGRGLEALAEHARWLEKGDVLENEEARALIEKIRTFLPVVVTSMEKARQRNGGRLPFIMTKDGIPLHPSADGGVIFDPDWSGERTSLSDLFYAKGLIAAGIWLGDKHAVAEAKALFESCVEDIRTGVFRFGQIGLDPKNPVKEVAGRLSHAPRMIGLGAATVFLRTTGEDCYAELGLEFIDYILTKHTNTEGDFHEFIGVDGSPWQADGCLWSDPGHATEFTGLAFSFLDKCSPALGGADLKARLRCVLMRNFRNGFNGKGIVKALDLRTRLYLNTDLPWWSLPETIRATMFARREGSEEEQQQLDDILVKCWNAFVANFVREDFHLMAYQCLHEDGALARVIPATPDADPCYHTGLSLIDGITHCHRSK